MPKPTPVNLDESDPDLIDPPKVGRAGGVSLLEVLDRLDRAQDRASKERQDQAVAFSGRIEEEAAHAQRAAETLVASLGTRVDAGFVAVNQRIGDIVDEQRAGRKEMRLLLLAMLAIIGGLGGLTVSFPGGVDVSPATTVTTTSTPIGTTTTTDVGSAPVEAPAPVEASEAIEEPSEAVDATTAAP